MDLGLFPGGVKTGCPSPILGWFDPCHGQSLVGRKVFSEFFQRFGYRLVGIVVMDIENFYLKMEILRVIFGLFFQSWRMGNWGVFFLEW